MVLDSRPFKNKPQLLQLNLLIQAYDYVIANYSDALESYGAAVGSGLSATALAEAKAIRDRVVEEFGCVSAVSIINIISYNFI